MDMRTNKFAVAAVLAAAALSANAAAPRMEGDNSPFTYEAVRATPSLTFGRAKATAPSAAEPPKTAAAKSAAARVDTPARAGAAPTTTFTYDALGATPHVEVRKATTEVLAQPAR
ncbi:MAG: hypothetical protein ACXW2G_09150 [Burkholderiaceae bacterium]